VGCEVRDYAGGVDHSRTEEERVKVITAVIMIAYLLFICVEALAMFIVTC